jgi:hypothetical protein
MSNNPNRKMRRAAANKKRKSAEKEMATKVALFGQLPDKCLACESPFDKSDKEQVMSWSVVVREEQEKVRLYCPECWDKAKQIVEDFKKHMKEKHE